MRFKKKKKMCSLYTLHLLTTHLMQMREMGFPYVIQARILLHNPCGQESKK